MVSISLKPVGLTHIVVSVIVMASLTVMTIWTAICHGPMSGDQIAAVWIVVAPTASYFSSRVDISSKGLNEHTAAP